MQGATYIKTASRTPTQAGLSTFCSDYCAASLLASPIVYLLGTPVVLSLQIANPYQVGGLIAAASAEAL